jgi:hypothetical protein
LLNECPAAPTLSSTPSNPRDSALPETAVARVVILSAPALSKLSGVNPGVRANTMANTPEDLALELRGFFEAAQRATRPKLPKSGLFGSVADIGDRRIFTRRSEHAHRRRPARVWPCSRENAWRTLGRSGLPRDVACGGISAWHAPTPPCARAPFRHGHDDAASSAFSSSSAIGLGLEPVCNLCQLGTHLK